MINSVPPRVTRSRRLPLDRYVNLLFTNYKKNDDHWIACWMSKNDGCVDSLQLEEVKTTLCKRGGASCVPGAYPEASSSCISIRPGFLCIEGQSLGWC